MIDTRRNIEVYDLSKLMKLFSCQCKASRSRMIVLLISYALYRKYLDNNEQEKVIIVVL